MQTHITTLPEYLKYLPKINANLNSKEILQEEIDNLLEKTVWANKKRIEEILEQFIKDIYPESTESNNSIDGENNFDPLNTSYTKAIQKVQKEINEMTTNIISLVSGGGTTMKSLAEFLKSGEISNTKLVKIIASKCGIGAIKKAEELNIHPTVLHRFKEQNPEKILEIAIREKDEKADILFGNGWLPLLPKEVIEKFEGVILNQHPGPLRKNHLDFGGKGMYGTRVTAARILYLLKTGASGTDLFTESTIHLMTEKIDEGYSVGVKKLDISQEIEEYREKIKKSDYDEKILKELIEDIQTKLLPLEHENVAEVVAKLGKKEILMQHPSYNEILVPEENAGILQEAKEEAIKLYPNG